MIKKWYSKCITEGILEHVFGVEQDTFIMFKGFRLTRIVREEGIFFTIKDARKRDFYTEVVPEEMKIFKEQGFINGARHLEYYRARKRVEFYSEEIEKEFRRRRGHERRLEKNPGRYQKAIDVCNNRISEMGILLNKYTEKCRKYERGLNYEL